MSERAAVLNARTITGVVYLDAADVISALRRRSGEATAEAESLGDELDEDGFSAAVSWRMVASEMTERADELQFAVIAHQSEPAAEPAKMIEGQFDDKAFVEAGRNSVYLKVVGDHYASTIALAPDSADSLAESLVATAAEARPS